MVVVEVLGRHVGRLPGLSLQLVGRQAHDRERTREVVVLLELIGDGSRQEVHEVGGDVERPLGTLRAGEFQHNVHLEHLRPEGQSLQKVQATPLTALGVPATVRANLLAGVVDLPFGGPNTDRAGLRHDFGVLLDHDGERPLGLLVLLPDVLSLAPARFLPLLPSELHELGEAGLLVRVARLVSVRIGATGALLAVAVALRDGTVAPVVGHRLRLGDVPDVHVADGGQQVHAVRPFGSS